jgi:ribosomal protein S18 acetylase RimI-like enzyme
MATIISAEQPNTAEAMELIAELDAYLTPMYPAESRHGFSVEKLIREGVAFFVLRQDGEPVACGGVKLFGTEYGEVKRMYVRPSYRGRGFGKQLLDHLAAYSLQQGVGVLRLETGIYQTEALSLYERYGFQRIGPFGGYRKDSLSVFFEKRLHDKIPSEET